MNDTWFEEKFIEISGRLATIETRVNLTNGTVQEHDDKIRALEDKQLVHEVEEKFHKKHPVLTVGGIGVTGISLTTLVGLAIKIAYDLGFIG